MSDPASLTHNQAGLGYSWAQGAYYDFSAARIPPHWHGACCRNTPRPSCAHSVELSLPCMALHPAPVAAGCAATPRPSPHEGRHVGKRRTSAAGP
eukprot:scaffold4995_cov385-Prasinococcus_capsulatus_cf.AAC.4